MKLLKHPVGVKNSLSLQLKQTPLNGATLSKQESQALNDEHVAQVSLQSRH